MGSLKDCQGVLWDIRVRLCLAKATKGLATASDDTGERLWDRGGTLPARGLDEVQVFGYAVAAFNEAPAQSGEGRLGGVSV
jgi:hypothetical protein